jgi:hypothetical protein
VTSAETFTTLRSSPATCLSHDQLEPIVHVVGVRPLDGQTPAPAPDQAEHRGRRCEVAGPHAVELEGHGPHARVRGRELDDGRRRVRERPARRIRHREVNRIRPRAERRDLEAHAGLDERPVMAEARRRRISAL